MNSKPGWKAIIFLFVPLVILGSVYPLSLSYFFRSSNFLILSGLVTLFYILSFKSDKPLPVIQLGHVFWIVLITIMFASSIWATNPYYAIYSGVGWTLFYLFMVMTQNVVKSAETKGLLLNVLGIAFIILLMDAAIIMFMDQGYPQSHFGMHRNVIAIHLLGLFPFFLFAFTSGRIIYLFKLAGTLLLGAVLVYCNSVGSIITYLILFGLFVIINHKTILKDNILKLLSGLAIVALLVGIFQFQDSVFVKELEEGKEGNREMMINNSFKLLSESPIVGIGAGNWKTEVYKYGLEGFSYADNFKTYRIQSSHNIFTTMLSEIGVLGFLFFLLAWGYPLFTLIRHRSQATAIQWASFLTVTSFLLQGLTYGMVIFFNNWLSPIMLLAVFGLGQLQFGDHTSGIIKYPRKIVLLIVSALVLGYYLYESVTTVRIKNDFRTAATHEEKLDALASKENRFFYYDYRGQLIPELIAERSLKTKNHERTEAYFEKALEANPYDAELLYNYADFLFIRGKKKKSETQALKAFEMHPKYYKTLMLLSRIYDTPDQKDKFDEYYGHLRKVRDQLVDINERIKKKAKRKGRDQVNDMQHMLTEIYMLESKLENRMALFRE